MQEQLESTTNTLLNYFEKKGLTARPSQIECLDFINKNLNKYKFFILQLPTGVGKSHIGLSLTEFKKHNLYVSSNNQLIKQYLEIEPELNELYGKSQYPCNLDENFNCANAKCCSDAKIKKECRENDLCEYYLTRELFISSRKALTNYAFTLGSSGTGIFSEIFATANQREKLKYDYVVMDEAHNLEQHLVSFATIKINLGELLKNNSISNNYYLIDDANSDNDKWNNILDICRGIESDLKHRNKYLDGKLLSHNKGDVKGIKKIYAEKTYIEKILFPLGILLQHSEKNRWVFDVNYDKNEFTITPINVNFVFSKYLKNLGNKFIFMSATIGDPKVFTNAIGLPEEECCFFECDSPFDVKNSPIFVMPRIDMSYKKIDEYLPKALEYVEAISDKNKNHCGIIHSGNYKVAEYIYRNASTTLRDRIVCKEKHDNCNNSTLMEIHKKKVEAGEKSILLSPSLVEGVDLKDDLSRWQIIIKLPFASLADKRIKFLSNVFPKWYSNDVIMKIIQACGRSTRHSDDKSVTYILDKSATQLFARNKLPVWFKKRLFHK